jgi:hypothetical protein
MNTIIFALAIVTVTGLGFLVLLVMLLIGMRTEGRHLSPSSESHAPIESAARRLLGVYVHRASEKSALQYDVRR